MQIKFASAYGEKRGFSSTNKLKNNEVGLKNAELNIAQMSFVIAKASSSSSTSNFSIKCEIKE